MHLYKSLDILIEYFYLVVDAAVVKAVVIEAVVVRAVVVVEAAVVEAVVVLEAEEEAVVVVVDSLSLTSISICINMHDSHDLKNRKFSL
jgi:hypothetical protein